MPEPIGDSPDEHDLVRVLQTLAQPEVDEQQVESLVQSAGQPMLILDVDAHVLSMNPRAEALLEREAAQVRGRPFASVVPVRHRSVVRRRIEEAFRTRQGPSDLAARVQTGTGEALDASLTFLPFRAGGRVRLALLIREGDAESLVRLARQLESSEAKRAASEEQLTRNQKLTDLGGLASGVAHEIKTPTAYIENLAYLSEKQAQRAIAAHPEAAAELTSLRSNAALIREGAQRIRHLLQELQPLARNRPSHRRPVDLAALVADAVRTFQGSARDVTTRIDLDLQTTHPVELDIEEMSRVLLNLVRNASEAMGGAGRITIRTRNRDSPPQIRVEDEGPGIADATRLFEPFYTTKKEGTGLGLAISRRIVEAHGGAIWHERNEHGGATFVIEFRR